MLTEKQMMDRIIELQKEHTDLIDKVKDLPTLWRNGRISAVGDGFAAPAMDEICLAIDAAILGGKS